jgi:hypothetical protein
MKMKKCILAVVMALVGLEAGAQSALPFIRIDRNPRSSAMAGAGMASVNNGWYAAFGNAAQLGFQPVKGDVGAALQLWEMSNDVDKTTNLQAGAGLRFGSFGVALGGAYQMGVMQGTYTPSDRLVSLGLAYNIGGFVSIGLNARYAAQSFTQEAKVSGFSIDISALGRISPEITVALGVGCLGGQVQGSADAYPQPAYARAGAAWHHAFGPMHALELALDGEYNFDGTAAGTIGLEYAYNHTIYARAGYRLAGKKALIPSHLGLGVGLQFRGFRLEASYLTASEILGNTLNLGVAYKF